MYKEIYLKLCKRTDVNFSLGVSMISMWIFRIVCSYILVMVLDMGAFGVWIGCLLIGMLVLQHILQGICQADGKSIE